MKKYIYWGEVKTLYVGDPCYDGEQVRDEIAHVFPIASGTWALESLPSSRATRPGGVVLYHMLDDRAGYAADTTTKHEVSVDSGLVSFMPMPNVPWCNPKVTIADIYKYRNENGQFDIGDAPEPDVLLAYNKEVWYRIMCNQIEDKDALLFDSGYITSTTDGDGTYPLTVGWKNGKVVRLDIQFEADEADEEEPDETGEWDIESDEEDYYGDEEDDE